MKSNSQAILVPPDFDVMRLRQELVRSCGKRHAYTSPDQISISGGVVPRGIKKCDLPQKVCARCGRPFAWRKKWVRDWEAVRYCSERCKRGHATPEKKEQNR
jgi:hypothetical protein